MKHEPTNRTRSVVAYAHDAKGNLTSDGVFSYAYDTANQLTNVVRTADGARVLSARYDALGQRVEATRADGTIDRYVYFPGSFLVLAVLDGTNAVKEIYTRGPDLSGTPDGAGGIGGILACTYASGATYYSHADIMGNVIALTDASGSVVSTFRYTPFGQLSARTGTLLPRYLFSSKEFDRTASLYYYGYRYYSPHLGRWMTRDPIGEAHGAGLYDFVRNHPLIRIDLFGLSPFSPTRRHLVLGLPMFSRIPRPDLEQKDWGAFVNYHIKAYFRDLDYSCSSFEYSGCSQSCGWQCTVFAGNSFVQFELKDVWMSPNVDRLLIPFIIAHEQGHVDIAEQFESTANAIIQVSIGFGIGCTRQEAQSEARTDLIKTVETYLKQLHEEYLATQDEYDETHTL